MLVYSAMETAMVEPNIQMSPRLLCSWGIRSCGVRLKIIGGREYLSVIVDRRIFFVQTNSKFTTKFLLYLQIHRPHNQKKGQKSTHSMSTCQ